MDEPDPQSVAWHRVPAVTIRWADGALEITTTRGVAFGCFSLGLFLVCIIVAAVVLRSPGQQAAEPTAIVELATEVPTLIPIAPTAIPTLVPLPTVQPTAPEPPSPTIAPMTIPTAIPAPTVQPMATPFRDPAGVAPLTVEDCPPEYPIKGNVASDGERFFHSPGGRSYNQTHPEWCYATAQDAIQAGYQSPEE